MLDRVREMRDQRARLRVDLASLQAEAPIDAVRPIAEPAVGDRDWANAHLDPTVLGAAPCHRRRAGDRMGRMRIGVRVAPRPVLARHWQLALDSLEVRLQVVVGDRPVDRDAVACADLEVRG